MNIIWQSSYSDAAGSYQEVTRMKDRVGIGVVGAGAIGIRGALSHLTLEDVQDRVFVAAVCDAEPGRAEAAAEKYGVPHHYLAYEELLDDPAVDAVTICTPIGLHYEQGLKAIDRGKHIHFNKTMTTVVSEADDLIEKASTKGLHVVASPGMMLHPHNQKVRKLILEGSLGRLCWAATGTAGVGNYHMNEEFRTGADVLTSVDPSWYFKKPGGGPQYDVTVYCLHILTGMLGPAKSVTAFSGLVIPDREYKGKTIQCDMDDTTMMILDFGGSLFAVVYAAVAGSLTEGFQPSIFGTEASIIGTRMVGSRGGETELKIDGESPPHVTSQHASLPESHVFEDMMQLVDAVREGTPTLATPEHARHVIDIIESAYRSAETGTACGLKTTFTPLSLGDLAV